MRRLLPPTTLLALLLLGGCSVFQAGEPAPAEGGWEQHDGYSLRCVDVTRDECERTADLLAAAHRARRDAPIISVVVNPGVDWILCWASTAGNQCTRAIE